MKAILTLIVTTTLFFIVGIYSGYAQDSLSPAEACKEMAVELEIDESELSDYIENCIMEIQEEGGFDESGEDDETTESEETEESEA